MEEIIIPITKGLRLLNVDAFFEIIINSIHNKQIVFDFSDFSFITPDVLLILVTASEYIFSKTNRCVIWRNAKDPIRGYLDRMGINDLTSVQLEHPFTFRKRQYTISPVLVELKTITRTEHIGEAIQHTKRILSTSFSDRPFEFKQNLIILLRETIENSVEHSSTVPTSGTCFYALQKYTYKSEKHDVSELQIVVGDIGIGMLQSQRTMFPDTRDDADAIIQAFDHGRTSRPSGIGGMGFASVKSALEPVNGVLTIRSGKGLGVYDPVKAKLKIYRRSANYPGTQILFKIRLDK